MGRYSGTLHKLAEAGPSKRGNWNLLINYLEGYAVADNQGRNPKFNSPLPPFSAPSEDLAKQLVDGQGPKHEDTPLRIALKAAPSNVIAALCHLGPEAARMADHKGRLPLHSACRRSSQDNETDRVLQILILCYPEGLVHRDDGGRTPLHYLLWYHTSSRSSKIVEFFCQPLPDAAFVGINQPPHSAQSKPYLPEIPSPDPANKIPYSAAIIHDMKHGTLPLHYAVACGADKQVIKTLIQIYPHSKGIKDRRGRTALAWYLGAGELGERMTHVSGEAPDPNAPPIWERHISSNIVHLLLSSKVARTTDDTGRFPIHWAMNLAARYYHHVTDVDAVLPCVSINSVQLLLDNHIEALTTPDSQGQTPLHVLFETVVEQQSLDWKRMVRNKTIRDDVDLHVGGSRVRPAFDPPCSLVELLLRSPDSNVGLLPVGELPRCAAHVEDVEGRLPLHIALLAASSTRVVSLLIQSNPTGLLHTTEEQLQTPLHVALSSPYTTPLQSWDTIKLLMQAYVTSRHGTFVDGRLVLKMEDATSRYPLHYACENQASLEVTKLLVTNYPMAVKLTNAVGDLPLHSLLDAKHLFESSETRGLTVGATLATPMGWTSEAQESVRTKQLYCLQQKMSMQLELLCQDEFAMKSGSAAHGMLPLHIAVAFDAVPYAILYKMLETFPKAAAVFTNAEGHSYSPLDLHAMRHSAVTDQEKWHMVRELLFSFAPALDSHRQQEELLDQCAKIIRQELQGKDSTHMEALLESHQSPHEPAVEMTESFSSIEVPEIDRGGRPKTASSSAKMPKTHNNSNKINKQKSLKSPMSKSSPPVKKSIYDDDGDQGYVVSPDVSFDDDYFTDEQSQEEEYFSDDYDSRYDDDDEMFDDGTKKSQSRETVEEHKEVASSSQSTTLIMEQEAITVSLTASTSLLTSRTFEKPFLSEVAMRLWMFFALFKDPKSPEYNCAKQIDYILDGLDYSIVQKLLFLPIPAYVSDYLEDHVDVQGYTVEEVGNPNCQVVMYKSAYFVGRYEFSSPQSESLLVHRSMDGDTVMVRAIEHLATTVDTTEEVVPGFAEAAIWNTGVEPDTPRTTREMKVTKRVVCFKFMRNSRQFRSEVDCRKAMGVPVEDEDLSARHIVPLINNFDSENGERRVDKQYKRDLRDERFKILNFQADDVSSENDDDSIFLPDYPYAVVMPYSDDGDLYEHLYRHGALGMDKIREIGLQVGKSLQLMHEKGLIHGNVSLRNVAGVAIPDENTTQRYWALSDLSCATQQTSQVSYMAPVGLNGSVSFSTSAFPPEMFVKLTPGELKMYNDYWKAVETKHDIVVDKAVIGPRLDGATGDAYVPRCHFSGAAKDGDELPQLPYKLLPTQEAADIWSFGRFLFILCSSGHPLFPTNLRTGHLLDYDQIASWDNEKREELIYGQVENVLAQDLLLHVLSSHEERTALNMQTLLIHPFFTGEHDNPAVRRLVDQRTSDALVSERASRQKVMKRGEHEWLEARSKTLVCWDLEMQMRMHLTPSEVCKRQLSGGGPVDEIPYSIIILPYKLARNKAGKMTPSSKSDVALAEKMGMQLIALSKACLFACQMEEVIRESDQQSSWSLSQLCSAISDEFSALKSELIVLASDRVEVFRDNPLKVARRIIQARIKELQKLFQDSAFVYLVDEYEGVPILDGTYPIEVADKISDTVASGLVIMHVCILYARGIAENVSGLVKLIFEAAYPHIPPSWAEASKGLVHGLDETAWYKEVWFLREAIADLFSRKGGLEDLTFFHEFFLNKDLKRSFANLQRVTNGETSMWTTNVQALEEHAKSHDFKKAYKSKKEADQKLAEQDRKIEQLEKALEDLEFRKAHNLQQYPIAS